MVRTATISGAPGAEGWSQFHADGRNQGSRFVPTPFALEPAWRFEVGPVLYGSPVIGADGTIYVGNLSGDVIAVNPDGTERCRATSPFRVLSSPAVADDGTVYAVGTAFFSDTSLSFDKFRSTLIVLEPDCTARKLTPLPDGYTSGSPKVWFSGRETYVFLFAHTRPRTLPSRTSALFVFDGSGNLLTQKDFVCRFPVTGGPSIFEILKDFVDVLFPDFNPTVPLPEEFYRWRDPTVTVVHDPRLTTATSAIIAVGDLNCSDVHAMRWTPPDLQPAWKADEGDDDLRLRSSLTFVDSTAAVVGGRHDGKVFANDLASGDRIWTYDAGEPVLGTPATLGALIYLSSIEHIHVLDQATGELLQKRKLEGRTTASPALSGNKLHIGHSRGLQSFTLNLASFSNYGETRWMSSPAIAADGTVYSIAGTVGPFNMDQPSFLIAYPAR